MTFLQYKALAIKLFPQLQESIQNDPDDSKIYQKVFCYCCPADIHSYDHHDEIWKADLFSLTNATVGRIRGEFYWE